MIKLGIFAPAVLIMASITAAAGAEVPAQYRGLWCDGSKGHYRCREATSESSRLIRRDGFNITEEGDCRVDAVTPIAKGHRLRMRCTGSDVPELVDVNLRLDARGRLHLGLPTPKAGEHSPSSQPSASIIIEFPPVPLAPRMTPPWTLEAESAKSAAVEQGRAAAEMAAREKSPVLTWKSRVVARLNEHKRYPEEAKSHRDQGVVQVFFSLDRHGGVLESRVVKPSGFPALDEEALALLRRAEPFPSPPEELTGDHIDLTVPIRFNFTNPANPN